jgi:hypothetical protein
VVLPIFAIDTGAVRRPHPDESFSTEQGMLPASFESSALPSKEHASAGLDRDDLLGRLPLSNAVESDRREAALRARELALDAREADLVEWEQCLEAREADLHNRQTILEWRNSDDTRRRTPGNGEFREPLSEAHRSEAAHPGRSSGALAELDRKVDLMNDLLQELKQTQLDNLAEQKSLDEQSRTADRRDEVLERMEASLAEATNGVASAQITVAVQQEELEQQRGLVRTELEQLQADRRAFESDREKIQQLLASLHAERSALQREREQFLLDCGPLPTATGGEMTSEISGATAAEAAASAESHAEAISSSIEAELQDDKSRFNRLFSPPRDAAPASPSHNPVAAAPVAAEYELHDCDENSIAEYMDRLLNRARNGRSVPAHVAPTPSTPAPVLAPPRVAVAAPVPLPTDSIPAEAPEQEAIDTALRPRQNAEEIRAGIQHLRSVANQSAHQALSRHFWKRHRSAVTLKIALLIMSFSLAAVLSLDHGVTRSPFTAVAWGAAAIGLITASNLVHTLTELNRLNARFQQEAFGRSAEADSTTIS